MKTRPPFTDVGLQYADHALASLALETVVRGRCTCGKLNCKHPGKHPKPGLSWEDASTDRDQLELWGEMYPNANIGIAAPQSNLIMLDVDPRNGGFDSLAGLICKHGELPRTVEDRTGGGGTHYYFKRPSEKLISKGAKDVRPGIEAIVNGYVVSPWSVTQGPYTWRNKPGRVQFAEAPDWLIERLLDPAAPVQAVPFVITDTHGIPREAWHILAGTGNKVYGCKPNGAQDRSAAEYTALLCLVNQGWDFERIYSLFSDRANERTHYAELAKAEGERTARAWLQRMYKRALEWSTQNESAGRKIAREFLDWARAFPFPGQTGAYTQAVALAHGAIALRAARTEYQASERELAERAGCSRYAVQNANTRLVKMGAIKRSTPHTKHTPTLATRWEIATMHGKATPLRGVGVLGSGTFRAYFQEDVFRRGALGKVGASVWEFLQSGPRLTGEIVKGTGRSWRAVIGSLSAMRGLGMVQSERAGHSLKWQAVPGVDLAKLAGHYGPGVQGKGERQKERHKSERDAYKAHLASNAPSARAGGNCA